ncbi:MAG: MBL fold metallo-hydrolase [Flavobacteriales bacterium]|nr:MBL fold metallo-hydrolase [Flavobacteriales bacterium]
MKIKKFTFNPFSENTYVVSDENKQAAIFDPGMSDRLEEEEVMNYLNENGLEMKYLVNTHCHIDHIIGNQFIADKFQLKLQSSEKESLTLGFAGASAQMWNVPFAGSPNIEILLKEGDVLKVGIDEWEVFEVPGHSVGHLIFVNRDSRSIIGGDTLFQGSIGRTDLPGGDHEQLLKNIKEKMFCLPDEFVVYSGHGPETTIGSEKQHNPWLQ